VTHKIPLVLACGDYELTRPLMEGLVAPDGVDLTVLTRMDSTTRHWRFLRNGEFAVAEASCSSYLVARDAGMALQAIPVFLHRRFRHGFVFVNTAKGIRKPTDLIGRKIGVKSFQVTAVLWMRGILEHEYGVPHKSVEWFAELDEDVEFTAPPDLRLTKLPSSKSVETMLLDGELDAVIHADLLDSVVEKDPRIGRLFVDYKAEEIAYYRKTAIFPIMHVLAIRQEIVEQYPWLPINLYTAFNEAKASAMERMMNPRIVPLAWYREAWEEQQELLGPDPWEFGLTERNRKTLETLIGYSYEHGLIKRRPALEELFLDVSQGRKRGEKFRI
jgi:4,5-dihydroxyphthalate decarboxylase